MVASLDDLGSGRGLQRFDFHGSEIRTVLRDGDPWWVAADVCGALGIADTRKSVSYLDEDERTTSPVIDSLGREQQTYIVNEPGLYSLILRSRKPEAKAFKRWITHEVLPALRKTGSYSVHEVSRKDLALMVIQAEEEKEALASRVRELEPAAQSWTVLAAADGDFSVGDAAKILARDPRIQTGPRRLFTMLITMRWAYRQQADNRPRAMQYAVERGWLSELPQSHNHPETGELVLDPPQVRVTVKGLHELHKRLGGETPLQLSA